MRLEEGSPPEIWNVERPPDLVPPRPERHFPVKWLVLLGAVLAFAFLLDLAYAGLTAYRQLNIAHDELRVASDALLAGDLDRATVGFMAAGQAGAAATQALDQPAARAIEMLPFIGDDVRAGRAIAQTTTMASSGAVRLTRAARFLGWDGRNIRAVGPNGRVDTTAMAQAAPALARAADLLARAYDRLDAIGTGGLLGPTRSAVDQAKALLAPRVSQARTASRIATLLPPLLGGSGERTYLFVMLQTTGTRGSGGYPGMYAILTADGNKLSLSTLRPTSDIRTLTPVPAPPEVGHRYDRWDSRRAFIDTTYTPDFPTAARLMMAIWAASGHAPVDGVIATDATMAAGALRSTGAVRSAQWPGRVSADDVGELLGRETYLTLSRDESNRRQTAVGNALWHAFFQRTPNYLSLVSALDAAVGTRDLQLYSRHPAEEQLLGELGIDGAFSFPSEQRSPVIVYQSFSENHAGYFARFHTTTDTETTDAGTRVTVTVTLRNAAPRHGHPSLLLGRTRGPTLGQFGVWVDVYLPEGGTLLSSEVDGGQRSPEQGTEFDHPVVTVRMLTDPGTSSVAVIRYLIPS